MAPRWSRTIAIVLCLAGCGSVREHADDTPPPIDATDAPPLPPIDATDAPPPIEATSSFQLGAGAGHLQGPGYQLDVQLGASWSQAPAIGAGHALRGSAPVLD